MFADVTVLQCLISRSYNTTWHVYSALKNSLFLFYCLWNCTVSVIIWLLVQFTHWVHKMLSGIVWLLFHSYLFTLLLPGFITQLCQLPYDVTKSTWIWNSACSEPCVWHAINVNLKLLDALSSFLVVGPLEPETWRLILVERLSFSTNFKDFSVVPSICPSQFRSESQEFDKKTR